MKVTRVRRDVYCEPGTLYFGLGYLMTFRNLLKGASFAKSMENHSQSLELHKNFHHFHGTSWLQISFIGKEWTF